MFPLDLLPGGWVEFIKALPFPYLAYFPAMVFLNKIAGMQLVYGLLIGLGWAVGCFLIARLLYQRGLKQYSSYGG
jgi:ABC-2 type transport system permease protein